MSKKNKRIKTLNSVAQINLINANSYIDDFGLLSDKFIEKYQSKNFEITTPLFEISFEPNIECLNTIRVSKNDIWFKLNINDSLERSKYKMKEVVEFIFSNIGAKLAKRIGWRSTIYIPAKKSKNIIADFCNFEIKQTKYFKSIEKDYYVTVIVTEPEEYVGIGYGYLVDIDIFTESNGDSIDLSNSEEKSCEKLLEYLKKIEDYHKSQLDEVKKYLASKQEEND